MTPGVELKSAIEADTQSRYMAHDMLDVSAAHWIYYFHAFCRFLIGRSFGQAEKILIRSAARMTYRKQGGETDE
jgi:hypothetical protein